MGHREDIENGAIRYHVLFTLPAYYADQGLCNGWASVRPSLRLSVPLIDSSNSGP